MPAVWSHDGSNWRLLAPVGFSEEKALHELVEEAPQLLPLSGAPQLVVLGREVRLGNGYADLVAVEPSGRLAIIEIKLAGNAEARRAVVAQVLAYAAFLHRTDPETLERDILGSHLRARGHQSLLDAVASEDQEGSFDPDGFISDLAEGLRTGCFRLVFVLDDAPSELTRLVGYLEAVTAELVIDLVTVTAYEAGGERILVPQRVDPERQPAEAAPSTLAAKDTGHLIPPAEFAADIETAPPEHRSQLRQMYEWAVGLEAEGIVRLLAYRGKTGRMTLLPYVLREDAGLVTVWNDGAFSLSFWRSVFERRAPQTLERIEALIRPATVGQGNTVKTVGADLLAELTAAYREAAAEVARLCPNPCRCRPSQRSRAAVGYKLPTSATGG
jgi:hypothetical protein